MPRSKNQKTTDRIKYIRERLSRAAEVEVEMLIHELISLAKSADDPRIKLAAIKEILDRGAGKAAPVASEVQMDDKNAIPPGFHEWMDQMKQKFYMENSELGQEKKRKDVSDKEDKEAL